MILRSKYVVEFIKIIKPSDILSYQPYFKLAVFLQTIFHFFIVYIGLEQNPLFKKLFYICLIWFGVAFEDSVFLRHDCRETGSLI